MTGGPKDDIIQDHLPEGNFIVCYFVYVFCKKKKNIKLEKNRTNKQSLFFENMTDDRGGERGAKDDVGIGEECQKLSFLGHI